MSIIKELKPADPREVSVYSPYCHASVRTTLLPLAIALYQKGSLEGERKIESGDSIPFVATWFVSSLPLDMTRCRMQFDGNADLTYEVMLQNSELVNYLIELIGTHKKSGTTDFSSSFYRKLLRVDEQAQV